MSNSIFLSFIVVVVGLVVADQVFEWGAALTFGKWLFGAIDWLAFWRYI